MRATGREWDILGIACAVLALCWLMWTNRWFVHDDAFISLRYARNFAELGVLEWNPGERVEGYTNFLHLVIVALLIKLGADPVLAAQGLNLAAALACLLAVAAAARRIAPEEPLLRFLTVIVVGATPGVAIWVLGGLETVLVAAFLAWGTFGLIVTVQEGRTGSALFAAIAFCLAILTRLDSAVFIAGAGLAALILVEARVSKRFLLAFLIAGLPALVSLAHMAFRLHYYGLPFPLTFYAKTQVPFELRKDFWGEFLNYTIIGAPVVVAGYLAAFVRAKSAETRLVATLTIPVTFQLLYVLWSGGDHMPASRVLVPLAAPAALMLLAASRRIVFPGLALALTVIVAVLRPPLTTDPAAFVGRVVGEHLATWEPGQTISVATAGSTPFYADKHIYIDQLGLNDPVIAMREDVPIRTQAQRRPGHAKGDGAYILSREPDAIILGTAEGTTPGNPVFLSDLELSEHPEFARCYAEQRVDLPFGEDLERRNPDRPNPITLIWYKRVCPKTS